jgi:hypothetical protein
MTTLYVVHGTRGGFVREDNQQSQVIGVYTDETVAAQVARIAGGRVDTVALDHVAPGYLASARELGTPIKQHAPETAIQLFDRIWRTLAIPANHVSTQGASRMDNWSVDCYERADGFYAGMTDAGYYKYVGFRIDGKFRWRVSCNHSHPGDELRYDNISREDFLKIKV